jgi:hypothetical protein|tara:strand:- start:38 stop:418 length:381 start_codon:yes stop_codon:yes gene_type:complete
MTNVFVWTKECKKELETLKAGLVAETRQLESRNLEGRISHLEKELTSRNKQLEDLKNSVVLKERKETRIRQYNTQSLERMNRSIIKQKDQLLGFEKMLEAHMHDAIEQSEELEYLKQEIVQLKDSA